MNYEIEILLRLLNKDVREQHKMLSNRTIGELKKQFEGVCQAGANVQKWLYGGWELPDDTTLEK